MPLLQTKHLRVHRLADGVADIVLDRQGSAINYLDPTMLGDIERALDLIRQAGQYHLLILRSVKPDNFCRGLASDVIEAWTVEQFAAWAERGQAVCAKLADMPMPTVAVIDGNCLDAGLELALACDYRVVVDQPDTLLGFADLACGLTPCWGATQRLPRLIGLENSLHMLVGGMQHSARAAWQCGLADHFSEKNEDEPPAFLADPHKRDWSAFPRRNWRERYLESHALGRWFLFRGAERILQTRVPTDMPAPGEMLAALRLAHAEPTMTVGLEFERQAVRRVVEHPAIHHLMRVLHHGQAMRDAAPGTKRDGTGVRQLGIIGSGIPALSLLLQALRADQEVVLRTRDEASLGTALAQVMQVLQSEVERGAMAPAHFQKLLGAVRGTYSWTHFDKLDMVVDTTDGTLADKQAFFKEMETHVPPTALLVAAPYGFRVQDLASVLQRPMRVLGLRIIEPWQRESLTEIVTHERASPAALQRLRDWVVELEKICLLLPDQLGGLALRVWLPALNEAGLMVREGIDIGRIDEAMRRFGMSHGPCEWMDRLGLDHAHAIMQGCAGLFAGRIQLETGFGLMVQKGWLGSQADFGFYRRSGGGRKPFRAAEILWRSSQGEQARPVPALSRADEQAWIQRRLVTLTVLEAVRCLQERVVQKVDDLDCALCFTGWASHRGGPIGYARQLGHGPFAALCAELAHTHGPRFAPFAGLEDFLG